MELRQLKTFQTVAKLLSFNRAAEILNYAQSTVSAQIRSLEEELGVPLFDRLGKRVILTEAGQSLMRYAQKMLDIEEETFSVVSGRTEPRGSLCVRIPQSLATYYLPAVLSGFLARYPQVGFDISTCCGYRSLEHELKTGVTDVGFLLSDAVQANELDFEVLGIAQLVMVAHPGHALAGKAVVGLRDLEGEAAILSKHDCGYRMVFEQMLAEEGVKTAAVIEMNSIEAVKQCVMRGIGVTIMPEIAVQREVHEKALAVLPWEDGPLETAILMIWHRNKWRSPTLQVFMDMCREAVCRPAEEDGNCLLLSSG